MKAAIDTGNQSVGNGSRWGSLQPQKEFMDTAIHPSHGIIEMIGHPLLSRFQGTTWLTGWGLSPIPIMSMRITGSMIVPVIDVLDCPTVISIITSLDQLSSCILQFRNVACHSSAGKANPWFFCHTTLPPPLPWPGRMRSIANYLPLIHSYN